MKPVTHDNENSNTARPAGFRVVAYATDQTVPSQVPFDQLTHINYAFLIPNADGTFRDLPNTRMLAELIRLAHSQSC